MVDFGLAGSFSDLSHKIVDHASETFTSGRRSDGTCHGSAEILLDVIIVRQIILVGLWTDAVEYIDEESDDFVYDRIEDHITAYLIDKKILFFLLELAH